MRKAFEKQIKTTEDQGKKQIEALNDLKPEEQTKAIQDKFNKIFKILLGKKTDEIQKESKEIDFNNLVYYSKGPNIAPISFIRFRGPLHIFNKIKNSNTPLKKVEEDQKKFKSSLGQITSGDPEHKSKAFIIQDKELSIYLMIIQTLDLELFMKQNKVKLKEQDLKY